MTSVNTSFQRLSSIGILTVVLICFYLILLNNPFTIDYSFNKLSYLPHILIAVTITFVCAINVIFFQTKYKITKIDIAVYFWILTVLISRIYVLRYEPFFNDVTTNLLIASCFYFIIRQISIDIPLKLWYWTLLPALIIQLYLVSTKYFTNFDSDLSYMLLKGSLGNSGICAGFIVISCPLALQLVEKKKAFKYIVILILCFILLILRSRASFFTFAPIIFLYTRNDYKSLIKKIINYKYFKASILIFIISISTFLFLYKKNSALGRAFIWKLTIQNAFSSPFLGIGYGEFPETYKKWQATYFQSEKFDTDALQLVDLPVATFNEPLQIFVEQGLIGLLAFVLLVIAVWSDRKSERKQYLPFKLCLLAGVIFSLFSYPYHSLPIISITFIFLALVRGDVICETRNRGQTNLVFIILILLSPYISYYFINKRRAISDLDTRGPVSKNPLAKYEAAMSYLTTNGGFLLDYAKVLHREKEFQKCIEVLAKAERQSQDIEINLLMGDTYLSMGKSETAKQQFVQSMYALPNRLMPKYCLFKLYIEEKDTRRATNIGNYILNYPTKTNSIKSLRIQHSTREALRKLKRDANNTFNP